MSNTSTAPTHFHVACPPQRGPDGKVRARYEMVNQLSGKAVASVSFTDGQVVKYSAYPSEVDAPEFLALCHAHLSLNKPA